MKKMIFAAALLATAASVPVFAADVPAKPPAAPAAAMKPAVKPMHHMKAMPMKAAAKTTMKPAREPSTDQLNQQQLDAFKKS